MSSLRSIGLLVVVLLGAFLLRNHIPAIGNSIKQFSSEFKLSNIENGTQKVAEKLESTLPPPLRGGATSGTSNSSSPSALNLSSIILITNKERALNGDLPALSENAKLDAAAKAKVEDMFQKQYFEHISPSGKGPSDLAKEVNYEYALIGENLALGDFKNNQALLDAWMKSPGHRANILNKKFTEMGAAAEQGIYNGEKTWLAVQEFGEPLSNCPAVDVTLRSQIDTDKNDLDAKAKALDQKKAEIDSTYPKYGDAYNSQVSEYNSMLAAYNAEVNQVKAEVDRYNAEVRAYNTCIAQ